MNLPTISRRSALRALTLAAFAGPISVLASPARALAEIVVYKNPNCGCCGAWVDHLKEEGFQVSVISLSDVSEKRRSLGMPDELSSCHTATVQGYVLEGHVPALDVKALLKARPSALGLAVPGMPMNSPGMGAPTGKSFDVLLVRKNGRTSTFSKWPRTSV